MPYIVTINGIQKPDESIIATVAFESTDTADTGRTFYVPVVPGDDGASLTAKLVNGAISALAAVGITATSADIVVQPLQRG